MFVQWSKDTEYSGKAATLHVLVIHAMIVLLTYGEPEGQSLKLFLSCTYPLFLTPPILKFLWLQEILVCTLLF